MDKTKQLFDQRVLQQLEYFVEKNNLSTQARTIYRIHTAFQDKSEILLNRAMDLVTSNQLEKITNSQFEELQTQIIQKGMTARLNSATTLRKKLGKLLENISTIDTIESLSIIQNTQPKPLDPSKPSDTAPLEQPQRNVNQNMDQAIKLYQKAKHCYFNGKCINQNADQVVKLYQKVANDTSEMVKFFQIVVLNNSQMSAHLLDIKQELLQEVQVFIEHIDINKLLAIDFINIDKFEPLFTYISKNKIVNLINNKYSGNFNANEDLESENEDKSLPLLSTYQGKTALEDILHYCKEQYSKKVDSDFFKTLRTLIHNIVLKVQEEKKQLQIDSFFK
ncbi:hypothetical protein G9A89_003438 [Geosiphon pyriformis]|nr:hypothetical protein G9A89_003438 [Geosiphon pyriformis]